MRDAETTPERQPPAASIADHIDAPSMETAGEQELSTANISGPGHSSQEAGAPSSAAPLHGLLGFEYDLRTQLAWPSAFLLGYVFPSYLTSAIVKVNDKACLKASFPGDPRTCELEIWISALETQNIITQLFDIYVAVQHQRRGILLENDVFVEIEGSLRLSGTTLGKIDRLLGTANMCQGSQRREAELHAGQVHVTRCISVEVWPQLDSPSCLRLQLEAVKLSAITATLWPVT